MDDLAELVPASREVVLGPELKVAIAPITIGRLPGVLACTVALGALLEMLDEQRGASIDWQELLARSGSELIQLCAAVGPLEKEQVQGLNLAQFLALVQAQLEVNRDFFVERIVPQISGLAGAVRALRGRTHSSVSSQPATQDATS